MEYSKSWGQDAGTSMPLVEGYFHIVPLFCESSLACCPLAVHKFTAAI